MRKRNIATHTGLGMLALLIAASILSACNGKRTSTPTATPPVTRVAVSPTSTVGQTAPSPTPAAGAVITPTGVVAVVNGQPISRALFDSQMAQVSAFLKQQGLDTESEEGKQNLKQAKRQVLEQLIDQELIRQGAAEMGIVISDEKVNAILRKGVEQSGGQKKLEEWLKNNNMTYDQYREAVRTDLLANAVRDKVVGEIPDAVPQVHARQILLKTRKEAEDVLAQLKNGADFATLAKEKSLDISNRDNGGDLGFFPKGLMAPAVEKAAFSLQPGELSGVVESPFGFHIIQVLEVDPARELSQDMRRRLQDQKFRDWLQQRREQAKIERYLP